MYRRVFSVVLVVGCVAFAQVKTGVQPVVDLPNGPLTRIISPDKRWILIFECPDECRERTLWIEDRSSARRLVKKYDRSLAVEWAPDSKRFFVNDDFGSNGSTASVIEAATLRTTDVSQIITDHDPQAKQFLGAGHSYLRAKRWINDHALIVVLFGHFDEAPPNGLPPSFTVEYRVDLNGSVGKIFRHSKEGL